MLVPRRPDGDGQWLTPRAGAFDDVRALDGAVVGNTRSPTSRTEVSYQHGVDLVVDAVRAGDAVGGRADPAGRASPRSNARPARALLMPPKSTFFTPKLRTGLVIRPMP